MQLASTVSLATIQQALKGELAFSAINASGKLQYATGLQDAGVLDDLYYYPGRLGVVIDDNGTAPVKIKVWAPAAQQVSLQLFNAANDTTPVATIVMHEDNGVWVAAGDATWKNKYYLFSVTVWVLSDATDLMRTKDMDHHRSNSADRSNKIDWC